MVRVGPGARAHRLTPAPSSPIGRVARLSACAGAVLALAGTSAWAQSSPAPQRVEVTGSAIKRIDGEAALPVQVISRDDIDKAGVTTAAELLTKVAAAGTGLTDGASINTGGYDQKGFNSANLRGIGTSSTLVLLNGRRMANFASPGDDNGVDLNTIPAAAIQRVEVLLDGASALYGTDAIAGVINFITRSDYQGAEINAYVGGTQEGGAGKRSASLALGTGDFQKDGFNLFGVLDLQRTSALRSSQRRFIGDLKVPERLPHLLSGYTDPPNIDLGSSQLEYLQSTGFTINGQPLTGKRINLSYPTCNGPANLYLPNGVGGDQGCTYDYMRDTELHPRTEKLGFLGRGVLQLSGNHQLYAELSATRASSWYVGSTARELLKLNYTLIPALASYTGLDTEAGDPEIWLRARLPDVGNRESQLISEGQRLVLGSSGSFNNWDYDLGYNHSVNRVRERYTHGYVLYEPFMAGIADGTINPMGRSDAAGRALIDSLQINDTVRRARGTMDSVDAKLSGAIGRLDGGPAMLAVGGELRRETVSYSPSALLAGNYILGDREDVDVGEINPLIVGSSHHRWVRGLFAELALPLSKALDAQLSLRHDQYQGIGGTTNPKVGLRYLVSPQLLLRGSAGTGFRAPSLSDLYRPVEYGSTATLPDPVYCAAVGGDLSECADNWSTHRYSNPHLKPERSNQFSMGLVLEPAPRWSLSMDYWQIHKRDVIGELGDDVILNNLDRYGHLVQRSYDDDCDCDTIDAINLVKGNLGRQQVSGVDFVAELREQPTTVGLWGVKLVGTWVLKSRQQTSADAPYYNNLGHFVTDGVVQRWRHRLTVDWDRGPWGLTLGNSYLSGYTDHNPGLELVGEEIATNRVKAYSLWDMSGRWAASPQLTLRAGIQNLLDTPPPYSNQAYYFLSGYDPTYTDPRGRFYYASVQYRFQ